MQLLELWNSIDELLADSGLECTCLQTCNSACCRADISGVVPRITRNELRAILAFLASRNQPLPPFNVFGCRFLSQDGDCIIYEARPTGCRGFFCADDEYEPAAVPARYGQLLTSYLGANPEESETVEIRTANFADIEGNNWK